MSQNGKPLENIKRNDETSAQRKKQGHFVDTPSYRSCSLRTNYGQMNEILDAIDTVKQLNNSNMREEWFSETRKNCSNLKEFNGHWHKPKLAIDSLLTLPRDYVVSRTSVFVRGLNKLDFICNNILDVLRQLNVKTVYHKDELRVTCTNEDKAEYEICCYRGLHEYSDGIIVETRRIQGCRRSFHSDSRIILQSVKGASSNTMTHALDVKQRKRCCDLKCFSTIIINESKKRRVEETVYINETREVVENLLKRDDDYATIKGIEVLCSLLENNNKHMAHPLLSEIAESVFNVNNTRSLMFQGVSSVLDRKISFFTERDREEIEYLAFVVVLHALNKIKNGNIIIDSLRETPSWLMDSLIPTLLKGSNCHEMTRISRLCKVCIKKLEESSFDAKEIIYNAQIRLQPAIVN